MDAVDFRILAHLFRDAREPFERIGNAVGLSGNAVKARVHRLQEEGVLKGFIATPDPRLFGYRMAVIVFPGVEDLDARVGEILDQVPGLGAIRYVDVTLDNSVIIAVLFKDDLDFDRIERAASNIIGRPPGFACRCLDADADLPELSLLDWRIVRALRSDGRKTLKDIVEDTGASFKTVKKRLDRLVETEALWISPNVSTSEASGLVFFDLFVWLDDAKRRAEIVKILPKDAVAMPIETPEPGLAIHVVRSNLREAQEDYHKVKSAPGVTRAFFKIGTRHTFDQWLDAKIAAVIIDIERARREKAETARAAAAATRTPLT